MTSLTQELAVAAARLVVEEGLDYGSAKRRALKALGVPVRTPLPSNELIEAEVRTHIALFHADSQPFELMALRRLALLWMDRLAPFRPHISGAVWNGTATRRSDIYLQLFCDDPKSAEITLIDQRVDFEARTVSGMRGQPVDALSFSAPCPDLGEAIGIHLMIHDHDDLRGALKPDASGQVLRGDRHALARRLEQKVTI